MHENAVIEPRASLDETFEELYRFYYEAIVRHLRGLLRDPEQAEDLAQETFTRAYRAFPKLCATTNAHVNVRAWLYRIATNVAYDVLRRQHRHPCVSMDADDSGINLWSERPEQDDPQRVYEGMREEVRFALQRMSRRYLRALLLGSVFGYDTERLAVAFSIEQAAAKMLLSRARKAFRRYYAEAQRVAQEEVW